MNLEKMDLEQLTELENKIKKEKSKRVSIWDSLKLIGKKETEFENVEKRFKKEIEDLKTE